MIRFEELQPGLMLSAQSEPSMPGRGRLPEGLITTLTLASGLLRESAATRRSVCVGGDGHE